MNSSRRLLWGLLAAACLLNLGFLAPNAVRAGRDFWIVIGASNPERRLLQKESWFRAVSNVQAAMPLTASIRYVSSAPPWYLVYYLYPRLLRESGAVPAQRDEIRKRYPDEWILVYSEAYPAELTPYPPLNAGASHG